MIIAATANIVAPINAIGFPSGMPGKLLNNISKTRTPQNIHNIVDVGMLEEFIMPIPCSKF